MGVCYSYIAARGAGRVAILGALGLAEPESAEAKTGRAKFECWDSTDG